MLVYVPQTNLSQMWVFNRCCSNELKSNVGFRKFFSSLAFVQNPSCYHSTGLVYDGLKGELHNRLNLISEERVNFLKHNSENLMKIGWKIRKLWHFEVSQIFTKHFLTSRYEYANEWVDDVITSLLAIYFVHKILKNLIFCPNLW